MIARVSLGYETREKLADLAKSDEIYAKLKDILTDAPEGERRLEKYAWPLEAVIDLETEGRWLIDMGLPFEIKQFKGTMLRNAIPQGGGPATNVYVQVPHIGLLTINDVTVEENCCTDRLQMKLDEGWRILCVCPPNAARRPDYILGRTKEK